MPSLSNFAHYTFANLGPLTTPFTAAPACATAAPSNHLVGQLPQGPLAGVRCPSNDTEGWYADGCWPSAAQVASIDAKITATTSTTVVTADPDGGPASTHGYHYVPQLAEYFSPGVRCPDGWTTVATLDRSAVVPPTATADASTAAHVSAFTIAGNYTERPEWSDPFLYRLPEAMVRALEPDETLAFCCPRDYEGYDFGFCASAKGPATDAGLTEVCWPDITATGFTMKPIAVTATPGPFASATVPLTAYTITPAVPLVYRASDVAAATAAATTADEPAPTGTDATPTTNAGRRNAPGEGVSWGWAAAALASLLSGAGAFLL